VTAKHLSQRVKKVICCDVYSEMLELAQSLNKERENIEYLPIQSYDLSAIEENSIDIVYSLGLFIHFNLYDTYLYFQEFKRVLKPGGQCFLNIKDANELEMNQFLPDAKTYKINGYTTQGLQQWMAPKGVIQIAEYYDFELTDQSVIENPSDCGLYFRLKS
jgi:ubiquinone/menaquinone biosynthesis C-methylase UbiE